MRRKQNQKLYKTMMLSALAFMMLCSFRVSAHEIPVYKCINQNGKVVFQDKACSDNDAMQRLTLDINQSADIAPGLRAYEQVVQSRIFQKQIIESILSAQMPKQ